MKPTVEQLVEETRRALDAVRRDISGDPEKIRAFLASKSTFEAKPPSAPSTPTPADTMRTAS